MVGHQSWLTRFPNWQINFQWNSQKWPISEWDYLDSDMEQTACVWHGRGNEKKKVCSVNIISACNKILWTQSFINKFYEPHFINIMQKQLWGKPIYQLLSCFRKQHILSRLFIRIFFLGGGRGGGKGNQSSISK